MENFFSLDGPLIRFLEKAGQLILLGLVWCISSLLIISLGASSSALYYAVAKSVRKGRGYPFKEYFTMFKKVFVKGCAATLVLLALLSLALLGRYYIKQENVIFLPTSGKWEIVFIVFYDLIAIISIMISIYIFPVLSRFEMKLKNIFKLSFIISIRYFYYTLILVLIFIVVGILVFKFLPMWAMVALPGFMAYVSSFIYERAMKKYIVVTEDNKEQWYVF